MSLERKANKGLSITFSLAYLSQPSKNDMTLESILGKSELAKCVFCTSSTITLHHGDSVKLYDAKEFSDVVALKTLAIGGGRT